MTTMAEFSLQILKHHDITSDFDALDWTFLLQRVQDRHWFQDNNWVLSNSTHPSELLCLTQGSREKQISTYSLCRTVMIVRWWLRHTIRFTTSQIPRSPTLRHLVWGFYFGHLDRTPEELTAVRSTSFRGFWASNLWLFSLCNGITQNQPPSSTLYSMGSVLQRVTFSMHQTPDRRQMGVDSSAIIIVSGPGCEYLA